MYSRRSTARKISGTAFDHLCKLSESFSRAGARLVQMEGRQSLVLDNYVGVIQTPCGTTVEIVPKHHETSDNLPSSRALLRKLIQASVELPTREVGGGSVGAIQRAAL